MPLSGIKILDLTSVVVGPAATLRLADLGAEIIKIESLKRIDIVRQIGPWPEDDPDPHHDKAGYFNMLNRNKYSISLDMAQPRAQELARELIKQSDVVSENFSARVMRKFGLDYDSVRRIKPDVIMISLSGYGNQGPESGFVSYGPAQVPLTGLASLTGFPDGPPTPLGVSYGDPVGGLTGAIAVLAALHHRRRTGEGQYIDFSQQQGTVALLAQGLMEYLMNGRVWPRMGNRHEAWAPHNVYRCAGEDRWIAIAVTNEEEWRTLCDQLGLPDLAADPRFASTLDRWHNQDALDPIISAWTADQDDKALMEQLQAAGVPAASSYTTADLVDDYHLASRGFFVADTHPVVGPRTIAGIPTRLSETPGRIYKSAPRLGEDTERVLKDLLKLTDAQIQELIDAKVVY
jgi:benzylsuccinate CoA-transferase BbsF subunit